MIRKIQRAGLLAVCLIISVVVLASSASTFIQPLNNSWALALNPFNTQARIAWLGSEIFADGADLPLLLKEVENGYRYAPSEARLLSLAGVISEKLGEPERALAFYSTVLKTMPAEIKALSRSLVFAVVSRDFQAAARHAEMVGRRWPTIWPSVEPLLPAIMSDAVAFRYLADGFGGTEKGRNMLVQSLKSESGQALAYDLLIYWNEKGVNGLTPLVAKVSKAYFDRGDVKTAYFLFRQTLPGDLDSQGGYIFNGRFEREPSGNPFDWTFLQQPGVGVQRIERTSSQGTKQFEVELKFRNAPVQLQNLYQNTRLKQGRYKFSIAYRTKRLSAAKPIRFIVECRKTGVELGSLEVSTPAEEGKIISTEFEVPDDRCPTSRFILRNQSIKSSWKNRYSGTLFISSVDVEYLGEI